MSEKIFSYTVLKPISFKGDRIEKGSVIRMTPEEAENIGDEFLELSEEADKQEILPADESTDDTDINESKDSNNDSVNADKPEDGEETESKEDDESSKENVESTQTGTQPENTV